MPGLALRLRLCPDERMSERLWMATFLACVHAQAGRPTTPALCELAQACERAAEPEGLSDMLERLARGEGPLHRTR